MKSLARNIIRKVGQLTMLIITKIHMVRKVLNKKNSIIEVREDTIILAEHFAILAGPTLILTNTDQVKEILTLNYIAHDLLDIPPMHVENKTAELKKIWSQPY